MSDFIKKILWATDFSEESKDSYQYALRFAKTFHSEVIGFHVVPDFSPALYDTASVIKGELTKRIHAVKKEAEKKFDELKKDKGVPLKVIIEEGTASKKIIECAVREKADLIIMGKKGMSAIEKLFIGSVANQTIRHTPVPVLLTKKGDFRSKIKRILVPTDFSAQEEVEREYAWKLAKGFNSQLTLLYVLELHDYEFPPRVLDEMFKQVLNRLKGRRKQEKEDIAVKEEVVRAINASIGIVDYSDAQNIDMIVMSTCVTSKLERFFLGSTTEKVISYSRLPIFAIPPSQCGQ
jgi:nucleotide-binding universal stress UspA family protein